MCKIVGLLKRMWKNIISLAISQIDYFIYIYIYIYAIKAESLIPIC